MHVENFSVFAPHTKDTFERLFQDLTIKQRTIKKLNIKENLDFQLMFLIILLKCCNSTKEFLEKIKN